MAAGFSIASQAEPGSRPTRQEWLTGGGPLGDRVASISYDVFTAQPSLDRVVMKAAASPSSTPH
jgi:hypothetical protein